MSKANIFVIGEEKAPETHKLKAGKLDLLFQNGDLRHIKNGKQQLLLRVYAAVRDRNWNTIHGEMHDLEIDKNDDSFAISFRMHHKFLDIEYSWRAKITGSADSRVSYAFTGEALSSFLACRIGFCLLHPMHFAGTPCALEKADGAWEETSFPKEISPTSPFLDFQAMRQPLGKGRELRIAMKGELFETEDQRNWTDASYKTFCTPLSIPFPFRVAKGETKQQTVEISYHEDRHDRVSVESADDGKSVLFFEDTQTVPMPELGVKLGADDDDGSLALVKPLGARYMQVNLDYGRKSRAEIEAHFALACRSALPLLPVVTLRNDLEAEAAHAAKLIASSGAEVKGTLVLSGGKMATDSAAIKAMGSLPGGTEKLGYGTAGNFAEINRHRPPEGLAGFVGMPMTPQFHATDTMSVIENLAGMEVATQNAVRLAGRSPVLILPLTLRMCDNLVATDGDSDASWAGLPRAVDQRQLSLFGAAWLVAAVEHVAKGGAGAITVFNALTGWEGFRESESGSRDEKLFPSVPGQCFPAMVSMAWLAGVQGGVMRPFLSSDPMRAGGFVVENGNKETLFCYNLSNETLQVECGGFAGSWQESVLSPEAYNEQKRDIAWLARHPGEKKVYASELEIPACSVIRLQW